MPRSPLFSLTGSRAVITGASAGLGAEFARQLAPRADALLLVARRRDALESLRSELLSLAPTLRIELCVADLVTPDGIPNILGRLDETGLCPNLLINNAGRGDYGSVATADPDRLRAQIDLNITGPVLLTRALLPALCSNPASAILNVSSLAGTLPLPDAAVYAATKSFVTSFSEALRIEVAEKNVGVTAVCPGPTPTNFRNVARREGGADTDRSGDGFLALPPDEVVRQALRGLEAGRAVVYPGWGPTLAAWLFRYAPRPVLRWYLARRHARSGVNPAH